MTDHVVAIKVTSDGKAFVVDQAANAEAVGKLGKEVQQTSDRMTVLGRQNAEMAATSKAVAASTKDLSYAQQVLAERELAAAAAADRFMAKLQEQVSHLGKSQAEILRMQAAMHGVTEGAEPLIEALGKSAQAMNGHAHSMAKGAFETAGARRELIVLGHEALTGNFSRMPGSFMVLGERMGAALNILSPMVIGFVALGATAVGVGMLAVQAEQLQRTLNTMETQLTATGRAGMFTTGELQAMLHQVQLMPGVTKDASAQSIEAFTRTHAIGKQLFGDLTGIVADYAAATGMKLPESAKKLADAFADPVAGAKTLDKELDALTATQLAQIEIMVRHGDLTGAQRVLYEALYGAVNKLATQGLTPLQEATHGVGLAWERMTHKMGESDGMKAVNSLLVGIVNKFSWIIDHSPQILQVMKLTPGIGPAVTAAGGVASFLGGGTTPEQRQSGGKVTDDPASKAIKDQIKRVTETYSSYTGAAEAMAKMKDGETELKNAIALATQELGPQDEAVLKLKAELAGLREAMAKKPMNTDAVNASLEALKQQGEREKEAVKQTVANIESQYKQGAISHIDAIRQEAAAELTGVDAEEALLKRRLAIDKTKQNSLTEQARIQGELEKLEQQRRTIKETEENRLAEAESKIWSASFDTYAKGLEAQQKSIDKTNEQADVIEQEIATHGKSAQAILAVANAHLENRRAMMLGNDTYTQEVERINAAIAANNRLIGALDKKDAISASDAAAKRAEEAWTRSEHSIEEGLYSALSDGGDRGAKKLEKDLKNWALHLGLQIPVQLIGSLGASILNPNAASAQGNPFGMVSAASGANTLFGGVTSAYAQGAAGLTSGVSLGTGGIGASFGVVDTAAVGLGGAGGAFAGVQAALSAIPVAGWIAMGGLALASVFGGSHGGPKSEAGYAPGGMNIAGLDIGGNQQGSQRGDVAAAQTISQGISASYKLVADQLGIVNDKIDVGLFYAQDPEGDSKTQLQLASKHYSRSNVEGGIENVDRGDAALQEAIAKATSQLILTELQSSNLKGKVGAYIDNLNPLKLSTKEINDAITLATNAQTLYTAFGKLGPAFATVTDMTVEAIGKLIDAGGGMQALSANLSAYYDNFYSEAEKKANVIKDIAKTLNAAGVNFTEAQINDATNSGHGRDLFRQVMEAEVALGDAGIPAVQALLQVAAAFASIAPEADAASAAAAAQAAADKAAADAAAALAKAQADAAAATDRAYAALTRAVNAEKKILQARIDAAREAATAAGAIFDMLRGHVASLLQETSATRASSAAEGRSFIEQAIVGAKSTGYLPDQQELGSAIDAARSGLDSHNFATQADEDFARVVLAGRLKELQGISGQQKTIAQQQLQAAQDALDIDDKLLDAAQEQIDLMRGNNTAILTIPKAIDRLAEAMNKEAGGKGVGKTAGAASSSQGGAAFGAGGTGQSSGVTGFQISPTTWGNTAGGVTFSNGITWDFSAFAMANLGDPGAIASKAQQYGISESDIAKLMGKDAGDVEKWFELQGIPAFADGGAHPGGWATVGERGKELVWMPPSRVFNNADSSRMAAGESQALGALQREVAQLRQAMTQLLTSINKNTDLASNTLTQMVNGRPITTKAVLA
jgi:hypothetical protein